MGRKNGENGKEDKGKAEEDYIGLKNKELEHFWTEAAAKVGDMTAVVTTMDGRDIRTGQVDGQVAAVFGHELGCSVFVPGWVTVVYLLPGCGCDLVHLSGACGYCAGWLPLGSGGGPFGLHEGCRWVVGYGFAGGS